MLQDIVRARFPKAVTLRDGSPVTIRPLVGADEPALLTFFRGIPEADRIFLKDDVTQAAVIAAWCRDLDYARTLPLVAESEGALVGDATLHQRPTGWKRHVAKVRLVVAPAYRAMGLGGSLIRELMAVAEQTDLEKLEAEFMVVQRTAIVAFQKLGFVQVAAVFPNHVKDLTGKAQDLLVLVRDLTPREEIAMPA